MPEKYEPIQTNPADNLPEARTTIKVLPQAFFDKNSDLYEERYENALMNLGKMFYSEDVGRREALRLAIWEMAENIARSPQFAEEYAGSDLFPADSFDQLTPGQVNDLIIFLAENLGDMVVHHVSVKRDDDVPMSALIESSESSDLQLDLFLGFETLLRRAASGEFDQDGWKSALRYNIIGVRDGEISIDVKSTGEVSAYIKAKNKGLSMSYFRFDLGKLDLDNDGESSKTYRSIESLLVKLKKEHPEVCVPWVWNVKK